MLRHPPFNVQAVHAGEGEGNSVRALASAVAPKDPADSSQKEEGVAMAVISRSLVAQELAGWSR